MAVIQIGVTEPWKAKHAGISFVPKLLPSLHGNLQSCKLSNGPPLELPVLRLVCVRQG